MGFPRQEYWSGFPFSSPHNEQIYLNYQIISLWLYQEKVCLTVHFFQDKATYTTYNDEFKMLSKIFHSQ